MKAWRWLSSEPNGVLAVLMALQEPGEATTVQPRTELPPVVLGVVLGMELAVVSGAAFLMLLGSSIIGTLVHNVLQVLLAAIGIAWAHEAAVVKACEAGVFGWGLLAFLSRFFRRSKQELVQRLGRFRCSNATTCLLSLVIHFLAVLLLFQWQHQDQEIVLWSNIQSTLIHSDGSFAVAETLQNLLLAPLREELFFRGAVALVTLNRTHSAGWSVAISGILFAGIHLANARHLRAQYSASYVAFQVVWALVVGAFLALKLLLSGSLTECLALHVINNIFAMSVSKQVAVDMTQPSIVCSVVIALSTYGVATARLLSQVQAKHDKQDKQR